MLSGAGKGSFRAFACINIRTSEFPGVFFYVWLLYQIEGVDKPRIFSTKPLTSEEKRLIKDINPALEDYF
jgi:hypothetical protein